MLHAHSTNTVTKNVNTERSILDAINLNLNTSNGNTAFNGIAENLRGPYIQILHKKAVFSPSKISTYKYKKLR